MVVILNGPGQNGYRQRDPWQKAFYFRNEISTTPETKVPRYIVKYDKPKKSKIEKLYTTENQNIIEPPARVVDGQTLGRAPNPLVFNAPVKTEPTVKPEPTPVTDVGNFGSGGEGGGEGGGGGGGIDFNSLFRMFGDSMNFISTTALNAAEGVGQGVSELAQAGENAIQTSVEALGLAVDQIGVIVQSARENLPIQPALLAGGAAIDRFIRNPTTQNERLALEFVQENIVPTLGELEIPPGLMDIAERTLQQVRGTNTPYTLALARALAGNLRNQFTRSLPPAQQQDVLTLPPSQIETMDEIMAIHALVSMRPSNETGVGLVGSSRGTARPRRDMSVVQTSTGPRRMPMFERPNNRTPSTELVFEHNLAPPTLAERRRQDLLDRLVRWGRIALAAVLLFASQALSRGK